MTFPISRFRDTIKKEFDVEVITPLFSGGADGIHAELREAAFKGVMRFWWRAIYGSSNIKDMKKREDEIFGSTEIQSALRICIKEKERINPVLKNLPKGNTMKVKSAKGTFFISIVEYLAYGLYDYEKGKGNVFKREHIEPGSRFKLQLFFPQKYEFQIMDCFKILNQYGGFGAKSRNGFGALKFTGDGLQGYKIRETGSKKSLLPFTSFSRNSKVFLFKEQDKWDGALSDAGLAYKHARTSLEPKHSFNRRRLIATPIIVKGEVSINERHAKPYFLHVNKLENGRFQGQILFLPYDYHQDDKKEDYQRACTDMNRILQDAAQEVI